jgi:hypothetical protein
MLIESYPFSSTNAKRAGKSIPERLLWVESGHSH